MNRLLLLLTTALVLPLTAQQNVTSVFGVAALNCSYPGCPGVALALPLGAQPSQVKLNKNRKLAFSVQPVLCYGTPCGIMVVTGTGLVISATDRFYVTWTQGAVLSSITAKRGGFEHKR